MDSRSLKKQFSIALYESTDVSDSAQVLVLFRGVNGKFKITKELAGVHSMERRVIGNEMFAKMKETIFNFGLDFKCFKVVSIDGGKNMCGPKWGVVGNICNTV